MGPEVWTLCMQQQQQQATGKELERHFITSHSITLWESTSTCRPIAGPLALRVPKRSMHLWPRHHAALRFCRWCSRGKSQAMIAAWRPRKSMACLCC